MDTSYLITRYGKEAINELLDIVMMEKSMNSDDWRHFAVKHGIVTQATKTVRGRIHRENRNKYYGIDASGAYRWYDLDEPYIEYRIVLRNGRNQSKMNVIFKSTEIQDILKEL